MVTEIECGERNPSFDVMERLVQGLSVSLAELLSESLGTWNAPPTTSRPTFSRGTLPSQNLEKI